MSNTVEWEALRRCLETEKDAVAAEIQAYPRPIAGCDAQFNHLLERRRLLWEELSRLEAARGDRTASVGDFLQELDLPRCARPSVPSSQLSSLLEAAQPDPTPPWEAAPTQARGIRRQLGAANADSPSFLLRLQWP